MYWDQEKLQKYINTPEGNIEVNTGRKMSFSYYYTSKDHLGSIWHYWNSLSNKYSNIYYPSGIMREKRRSPFNYGLTGKEIVYDNGLDEYFFGTRTLFAPINRFNQPDPLCEEYYHISPYAYCANNFINAVDPDGRNSRKGNVSAEGRAADGIVQIITTYTQDKKIQGYASNTANSGKAYNASNFNCSTFVENALKTVFPTLDASQYIKIPFPLNAMYKDTKVIAPNNLYNATMKLPNAINIKGPKSVIAKPYLEYYGK